jgi:hypothetical protein
MIAMSANVRRLVLDISPAWWGMGLVWLTLVVSDGLWLARPGVPPPFATLLAAMSFSGLFWAKTPTWLRLPVSRADLARAQWRLSIGAPLLALTVAMGGAVALLAPLGLGHRTLADVLAAMGGQVAVYMAICSLVLIGGWARLSGLVWTLGLLTLLPLTLGASLVFWFSMTDATRVQMDIAGAAGLVAAAGWYGLGARARLMGARSGPRNRRAAGEGRATPGVARPGPRGWLAVNRVFVATLIGLVAGGAVGARLIVAFDAALAPVLPLLFALIGLASGMVYFGSLPIRVLRGLPLGAGRLTLFMFATGMGVQWLTVLILLALSAPSLPVSLVTPDLPWIVAVSSSLCAVTLPLGLRLGPVRAVMIIGAMIMTLSGPLAVSLISSKPEGSLMLLTPVVVLGAGAVVAIAWVWAWWQIARSRHAYRIPPTIQAR